MNERVMSERASAFVSGAPHVTLERGLDIWITEPLGLVTSAQPHAFLTKAAAEFIATHVRDELLRLWAPRPVKMRCLHDWALLDGYDHVARTKLIDFGNDMGVERTERVDILLSTQTG